jgi:hypothetical protein
MKKRYILGGIIAIPAIFVTLLFSLGLIAAIFSPSEPTQQATTQDVLGATTALTEAVEAIPEIAPEPAAPAVPKEYTSALKSADSYANRMNMSKQAVYDQLVSEFGGQFTPEAAQYAIDNVEADWNENALVSARQYQDRLNMSPAAIRDQLTSSYGGQFTEAEADYAMANL